MFVIIAAIGKNLELGKDNKLIWNIPSDLKFFKEKTDGKTILMGRKTFLSLPRLLPNRKHVVLTSDLSFCNHPGLTVMCGIEEVIDNYKDAKEEIYIIGGSKVYEQSLPLCEKMYLTEIAEYDNFADVFFPTFNKNEWKRNVIDRVCENGIYYEHVEYLR